MRSDAASTLPAVSVEACAKLNLFLDVLDLRDDGYHDVIMVNQAIRLSDRIDLRLLESKAILLTCTQPDIPVDGRNLAHKAAEAFMARSGHRVGVAIHIEKHIPMEAGLAGGSADAAATLIGLNRLTGMGLGRKELARIGEEVGSDVPFCVYGGAAWVTGRGESVEPLPDPPGTWGIVLISPEASVSTGGAYRRLDANPDRPHPDGIVVRDTLLSGNYRGLCDGLYNAFESVILPECEEIRRAKESLLESGAGGALMTGSGSNVFGLFETERAAAAAVSDLRRAGWVARQVTRRGMNVIG